MKLSELIAKYGDDNVKFQSLDKCATALNYSHKKGTTITFGTDAKLGLNGTEEMGLIVWMDRKKVEQILGDK